MYDGGMNLWYEDFFFISVYMYRKILKLCLGYCKNFININLYYYYICL